MQTLAEMTGIKRKDVEALFDALMVIVSGHMQEGGSGEVILPKLGIKVRRIRKNATKSRTMVSPLTGTTVSIESKPSRNSIKLAALKPIKSTLSGLISEMDDED